MVLVGANWTEINYWSAQYYDTVTGSYYSAQIRILGKSTQDVATNTSRIDFKWQKRLTEAASGRSVHNDYTYAYSMKMTGHSASWNMVLGTVSSASWVDIGETTDYWSQIAHNADGTCSITYTAKGYRFNGDTFEESGTITLPTIARASKPTVSPNPLTVGNTLTISTNRASTSFTHSVTVMFDDYYWNVQGVGASTTWSDTVANLMPYMNTWQKTVEVYCTTWNGTTNLGTTKTTFTLQVDVSVYKPVIAWGTASDTNATTLALETAGSFIKGHSNLQIQATATPNDTTYGDQVTKLTVALGGVSQTNSTAGNLVSVNFTANRITTATLTATATDSRGYSVSVTKALTLVNYSPISISTIEATRVNANGDETETGEYLKYTIKGKAFLGSFGQVTNALTVSTESKQASASAYDQPVTEQTTVTSGSGYGDFTINGITVGTYSASTQFDVKFSLADELSSTTFGTIRVHEGVPVAAWGEDHFDVYGKFHIHDRDDVAKYISIGHNGAGLSGILLTQRFTSASTSCSANWADYVNISVTVPAGYTFVGVIQTWSNGAVIPCYCNSPGISNGVVSVWWRNPTSNTQTATFTVNCLFIRT